VTAVNLVALWPAFDVEDEDYEEFDSPPSGRGGAQATVTYPATRLVSRVQIALGANLSADPRTWAWEDITPWLRFDLGVSLTVGRRDEATQNTTGAGQLKLDNRDARFTRRNPASPYFGLLSKNTPIWVTLNAGSGEKTRMEMFVNEWPKTWADKSANDSTVTIQCSGVLRRLQQGRTFKSPLRRAILATSPAAYWPLEDGAEASSGGSAAIDGAAMSPTGTVVFAAVTDLAGAIQAVDASSGMLTGSVSGASATSWHAEFVMKRNLVAAAFGRVLTSSSTFNTYRLFAPNSLGQPWQVFITDSTGGVVTGLVGITVATTASTAQWHHFAISAEQVGGNVVTKMYLDGVLEATDTTAGTLAAPQTVLANQNYDVASTTYLGHVAVGDGTTISGAADAVDGYAGEMAHVRIARLCREEGVLYESLATTSPQMGPQDIDNLLTLLRDAESVGGGVLYEKRWGLSYQSVAERYNATVGMALDFNQGHIAEVPTPADDDQRTRNRFTASRVDGSDYTAEVETGEMGTGTQGPGIYDDGSTFNVATDAQLAAQAGWRTHLGTIDEDRWPSLALNFARQPGLIDTWTSLSQGARITVANPLPQMPPDGLDLIVEGYSERWDPYLWTASMNCSPASAYRVNVVASTDGNLGRVDAANSYLSADATAGATTISVASPGALWRTGTVNFDIAVGGERMTVTNISGGSSPQTFTVTRAVNGIAKAQPATVGGFPTKVGLWKPGVYAL
jgi:hypothetical protein